MLCIPSDARSSTRSIQLSSYILSVWFVLTFFLVLMKRPHSSPMRHLHPGLRSRTAFTRIKDDFNHATAHFRPLLVILRLRYSTPMWRWFRKRCYLRWDTLLDERPNCRETEIVKASAHSVRSPPSYLIDTLPQQGGYFDSPFPFDLCPSLTQHLSRLPEALLDHVTTNI